ncbi:adenine nucleotide alpha hydrolase family protein [[Clostridium] polysaccharolyticum]|uniref:tRNA methyl transferase n=1 Tax=[Clostridium] polysaccharolyticum TaxID=29364 RepID=A0A1H9ZBK8_9FIRM|nr:hypothetical protein [[Clostridium] polysaccharolyticum]SES78440.1 tRNA methyl transferase [[Clostridium] polysaccharolyticum]
MINNAQAEKKVVILFSGGIDCSLSVLQLRKEGYHLDLLHFEHGASISNGLHKIRYKEIEQVVGEKNIQLIEMSHRGLFRKLSLANIEQDFQRYHTNLICLGCRMAMHTETIIYCLCNDIKTAADGSTGYQNDFPEQNKVSLEFFKKLYGRYGITYKTVLSDIQDKKEIKYKLLDNGISIQSMEDTCLFSNTFSKTEDEKISDFLERRLNICCDYIDERIKLVR